MQRLGFSLRPLRRQTLYPTELRAHPWLLIDSAALAIPIRVPILPKFRSTLEQLEPQSRRVQNPPTEGGVSVPRKQVENG